MPSNKLALCTSRSKFIGNQQINTAAKYIQQSRVFIRTVTLYSFLAPIYYQNLCRFLRESQESMPRDLNKSSIVRFVLRYDILYRSVYRFYSLTKKEANSRSIRVWIRITNIMSMLKYVAYDSTMFKNVSAL